jgi:hypothetical protein
MARMQGVANYDPVLQHCERRARRVTRHDVMRGIAGSRV